MGSRLTSQLHGIIVYSPPLTHLPRGGVNLNRRSPCAPPCPSPRLLSVPFLFRTWLDYYESTICHLKILTKASSSQEQTEILSIQVTVPSSHKGLTLQADVSGRDSIDGLMMRLCWYIAKAGLVVMAELSKWWMCNVQGWQMVWHRKLGRAWFWIQDPWFWVHNPQQQKQQGPQIICVQVMSTSPSSSSLTHVYNPHIGDAQHGKSEELITADASWIFRSWMHFHVGKLARLILSGQLKICDLFSGQTLGENLALAAPWSPAIVRDIPQFVHKTIIGSKLFNQI